MNLNIALILVATYDVATWIKAMFQVVMLKLVESEVGNSLTVEQCLETPINIVGHQ